MGKEKGCKLICWKPATRRIDKYFLVLIQSAVMWSSVLSLIFHFDLILAFPRMVVVMLILIIVRDDTTGKDEDEDDDNHAKDVLKPCRLIP